MQKRGVIEIQFNWIFILIIGAVILSLVMGFLLNQQESTTIARDAELQSTLATIFSGSATTTDSTKPIDIPPTKIEFSCDAYSIGSLTERISNVALFAPRVIDTDILLLSSRDVSMPFHITNALYMTSPQHRYIFLGAATSQYQTMLPSQFSSDWYSSMSVAKHKGEKQARFIFSDPSPPSLPPEFKKVPSCKTKAQ